MSKKKVVYLFGAGATHAEIINFNKFFDENFTDDNGLLVSNVSKRVMKAAQNINWFNKNKKNFTSAEGSLNIELLISLFEANYIPDEYITNLKELVQLDIKKRLTTYRKQRFYLHKSLFELHSKNEEKESLIGIISLNYDTVIDEAYKEFHGEPNYCFTSERKDDLPLLKLHGSFNWRGKKIYGKSKSIPILPIGTNKNYLSPPYNFIWGRAFELLVECEVLRIVGCSLSQNDTGLIDLLFKAHLERGKKIIMEIIDFQPQNSHHPIKTSYGFFHGIVEPKDIEGTLIADEAISKPEVGNPFKIWLHFI